MSNLSKMYYAFAGLLHEICNSYPDIYKYLKEVFNNDFLSILKNDSFIKKVYNVSLGSEGYDIEAKRLSSIFTLFSREDKKFYYRLSPLILNKECLYPLFYENIPNNNEISLLQGFEQELNSFFKFIKNQFTKESLNKLNILEKIFNKFYYWLYKYSWCLPSRYSKCSDISLFDNSRISAGIAACLKSSHNLIIMKIDISGIQKFLFNVKSGEGGIAKRLRGRSFFLTILPEFISRMLVKKLNYTIANILFCGGGNFEVIITDKDINIAKEFLNDVNEYLLKEFEGELGLVYEYIEFSENDISNEEKFLELNKKLNEKLAIKKFHKYSEFKGDINKFLNEKFNDIKNKSLCKACNLYFTEKGNDFCDWCEIFFKIGDFFKKIKFLIFSEKSIDYIEKSERVVIPFGKFGKIYLVNELLIKDCKKLWEDCLDIYEVISDSNDIELKDYSTGFKFIAKTLPQNEKGEILTFEEIAEKSTGDKKLGILKMDVDNLSKIFNTKEILSLSRKANLSRNLDLFFSGIINEICKENDKNEYHYILYSGGDDLFIISSWDKCIELAEKINKEFHEYTCFSENFTLSAGLSIVHPKYPANSFAELVDNAERFAKDNGKNKITIFESLIEWNELKRINDFSQRIIRYMEDKIISRSFSYKILQLLKLYAVNKDREINEFIFMKTPPDFKFYPLLYYFFKRNFYGNNKEKEEFLYKILDEYYNNVYYIFNYVLTKTREVR